MRKFLTFLSLILPSLLFIVLARQHLLAALFALTNFASHSLVKTKQTFRLSLLTSLVYIEILLLCHCLDAQPLGNSRVQPHSAPNHQGLISPEQASFSKLAKPFVSLVLLGPLATVTKEKSNAEAPASLVSEVLLGPASHPHGDFVVYVNAGAEAVGENFLAYLVRELMITPVSEIAAVAPVVEIEGTEFSHAVYDGIRVSKFLDKNFEKIFVLPEFGALAVRAAHAPLVRRILLGEILQGSLDIWRCGGRIQLAPLARMRVRSVLPVNGSHIELEYPASHCVGRLSESAIFQHFSDFMKPTEIFVVRIHSKCLTFSKGLAPAINSCLDGAESQKFAYFDGKRALRSVASCQEVSAPGCLCLDAGPNPKEGQLVGFYFCRRDEVSQWFDVGEQRLMWGSLCVNSESKLQRCSTVSSQAPTRPPNTT